MSFDPATATAVLSLLDWTVGQIEKSKGGGIVPPEILEQRTQLRRALAAESDSMATKPYKPKTKKAEATESEG